MSHNPPTVFTLSLKAQLDSVADFLEMAYYVLINMVSGASLSRLRKEHRYQKDQAKSSERLRDSLQL